jgi:plastocyanin
MKTTNSNPERVRTQHDDHAPSASRGHRGAWLIAIAACGLAIIVITAFLVSSGNVNNGAAPAVLVPTASAIAQVAIRNVEFYPASIEVKKGSVVEWKNDDLVPHTATSPSFDSGSLTSGQSWRHTFTAAGTFPYVCTFHPNMKGVVIVK